MFKFNKQTLVFHRYIAYFLLALFSFSAAGATTNSHYESAVVSFKVADFNAAGIHLKNALSERPNHIPSRVLNARLLLALGKAHEAKIELKKAEKYGADKVYLAPYFMDAMLLQRKFDEVLAFVDEHLNLYNQSINNTFMLYQAKALVGKHLYSKADRVLLQILLHDPTNLNAILARAQVALKRGKISESLVLIKEAMALDDNNVNVLLVSAVTHQISGEVDIAKSHVLRVLQMDPNNTSARLVYSVLLLESGELLAAKIELNKILAIVPNEPGANFINYLASISLGRVKESQESITHLTNILDAMSDDIQHDFPILLYLSSVVNFQQANYNKAEKFLVKYVKINNEDYKAQKLYAKINLAQQKFSLAESILGRLVIYQPTDFETIILYGKVLFIQGRYDKAEYYFQTAFEIQPEPIESSLNLAKLHMINGEYQEVISKISTHKQLNENSEALFLLVKAYLEIDEPHIALMHIENLQTLLPNDSYVYQIKGSALGLSGDINKAKLSFQRAMSLSPKNSQALIHLARIDVHQNKFADAIDKLTEHNKEFGPNSAVLIELGDVYLGTKNIDSAERMYLKALSVNTSSYFALTRLVALYQKNEKIHQAINLTETYLQKNKESKEIYEIAATLYYKNNETKKAITALTKAVKYSEDKERSLQALALLQVRLGLLAEAKINLIKALAWNNEFLPAYDKLIAIFISEKNQIEAQRLIQQRENITGHVAKVDILHGDLYSKLGELSKAEKYYQDALDKELSQQAILGLYRIYKKQNKHSEIITLLTSWLEKQPDDLVLAIALAETYRGMGQNQLAVNFYLNLLNRFPNNPILLNNIALAYLSIKELNKASELANRAYELLPKSVTVLDTIAWIEINKENYQKALDLLRVAYTLEHNNAEVNYHIAIALDSLGRREEAFNYLQTATKGEKYFPDKQAAILLLHHWENIDI